MKINKGRRAATALVLVMSATLAACGSPAESSSSDGGKLKIGFMAFDIGLDPFVSVMVDEIKAQAATSNVDLDVRNGANDLNKQIAQIQDFVTAKKDAIIVYPGDPEGIGPALRQADNAGIPVFAVNLQLNDGIPVAAFVGADDREYGRKQGEMLVGAIGENGNVGLIMGGLGTSAQIMRTEGIEEALQSHPGIKIVEKQSDGWQADKTLALTQDWLNKYPKGDLSAIVVQGPEAISSATWASKNGRDEVKWVLGDYPTDLVEPIKTGLIVGTVNQDPAEQGREVLKTAVTYLTGDKSTVQKKIFTPLPLIDRSNVDQIKPAFGL